MSLCLQKFHLEDCMDKPMSVIMLCTANMTALKTIEEYNIVFIGGTTVSIVTKQTNERLCGCMAAYEMKVTPVLVKYLRSYNLFNYDPSSNVQMLTVTHSTAPQGSFPWDIQDNPWVTVS